MGMDINGISNVTPTALTSNEPSNIENTETPVRINSINKKSNDEGVTYDIGEDGYWGVKQTSQRLFDFASTLAGDDVEKMHEMQKAMHKGFGLAGKSWGRKLPSICQQTMDAADSLFDNYYKSKERLFDNYYKSKESESKEVINENTVYVSK